MISEDKTYRMNSGPPNESELRFFADKLTHADNAGQSKELKAASLIAKAALCNVLAVMAGEETQPLELWGMKPKQMAKAV